MTASSQPPIPPPTLSKRDALWANLISPVGHVLAFFYPLLAISTGARAIYQLFFKQGVTNYLPVYLTAIAAVIYLVASIGFAYRRRWTWWLSVILLAIEALFAITVGVLSLTQPEVIGHTVWSRFGADYGFLPLLLPLFGLIWLLWPQTMEAYSIRTKRTTENTTSPESGS